jgi:hypothetical protein
LKGIESRANTFVTQQAPPETAAEKPAAGAATAVASVAAPGTHSRLAKKAPEKPLPTAIDDGRQMMHKVFVDTKIISAGDFDLCWTTPDLTVPPKGIIDPFIQVLADKGILPLEKSLKTLIDKSRMAYLPLDRYDADLDLTRTFPRDFCRRWCVLPFDRMSKSILIATANPFNQQAVREVKEATNQRVVWYLASPADLLKNLQKVFR